MTPEQPISAKLVVQNNQVLIPVLSVVDIITATHRSQHLNTHLCIPSLLQLPEEIENDLFQPWMLLEDPRNNFMHCS